MTPEKGFTEEKVSSSDGLDRQPKLRFKADDGNEFPLWKPTVLNSIIKSFSQKVFGEHNYEILTSSRDGLQRQTEHFVAEQRHDTDGYNIIPMGYCTYRNRSDDRRFTFNVNNISRNAIVSKFYPVFCFVNSNSVFMTEYLNSSLSAIKTLSILSVGTSQVVLSFEVLKTAKFILPSEDEQNKIANFITCLEQRIKCQENLVNSLKKYKRGLLSAIFERRIRFKADDGSEFPEWEEITMGEICNYRNQHAEGEAFSYVSTENMQQNCGGVIFEAENNRAVSGVAYKCGDTLVANIRPYLKKAWIADRDGVCSTDVLVFNPTNVFPDFLYCLIARDSFFNYVMSGAKGLKMPRGDKAQIMQMPLVLPSLAEQQKISAFLSEIDCKISTAELLLEAIKSAKRGLLQQLFI